MEGEDVPRLQEILDSGLEITTNGHPDDDLKSQRIEQSSVIKKLYEGPKRCDCCVNWVEVPPDDVRESLVESTEEQELDHEILLRYKKTHDEFGERPLTLYHVSLASSKVRESISKALEGYPNISAACETGSFHSPFEPFFHRWKVLNEIKSLQHDPKTGLALRCLIEALDDDFGKERREFEELVSRGVMTFDYLPVFYEPGSLIISYVKHEYRALRVVESSLASKPKRIEVEAEFIDFDGSQYGIREATLRIPAFNGSRNIESLTIIPLKLSSDKDNIEAKLIDRASRALELNKGSYKSFVGTISITASWIPYDKYLLTPVLVDGRIMIDPDGYCKYHSSVYVRSFGNVLDADDDEQSDLSLTDDQLMILSPSVRGYDFTNKVWVSFEVDGVGEVVWDDTAFEKMVLSRSRKRLINALVKGNSAHKTEFDDMIRGKGQGVIMLLSGPTGTGKTLTAESIAARLRLPLYTITASDLGSTAYEIEKSLVTILEITARWNAVLLLDEADAFLESRKDDEPDRNQRVAVFLRLLEYYRGVLILTTNRKITFDAAFHSRIHLTLNYPPLDEEGRAQIWRSFLAGSILNLIDSDIVTLKKHELNGRQIKNVVKMSQLLAESEGSQLSMDHVHDVLEISNEGEKAYE